MPEAGDLPLRNTMACQQRQEALDLASSSSPGAADDIIRPCRGAGRSDQDNGWFGAQQMLEGNR